ncbi:MAG: 5'-nucleotidase C-terminal domain-containing protein [Spirochaetales bacterium]|nr:5'-nucleotidase C-terminal domain-containing protein [Spirochaetales bacterium]
MKNSRKILFTLMIFIMTLSPSLLFSAGQWEYVGPTKLEAVYPLESFTPEAKAPTRAVNGKEVEINIFSTNDEHGWIFDWDFGQGGPRMSRGAARPSGLARVSSLYKKLSKEYDNSMLVSGGDSIQGTITSYYYNFIENDIPNPMSVLFEKMGYEAWVIGNHEVEQGNEVTLKVANEMAAAGIDVLSANAVWEDDQMSPFYKPYMIKEIDGVRVGILGLTTPGIPMWLADSTHEDHVFLDMVKTAQYVIPIMRNVEKCDVVIGLFHAGMNEGYDVAKAEAAGVPIPNGSSLVARAIGGGPTGLDAIITAHSHQTIDDEGNSEYRDDRNNVVNGVKFVQAQNWGEKLGHLSIDVKGVNGKWVVENIDVMTHPVAGYPEDPEILDFMSEYIDGAMAYAETPVAMATDDLPSRRSYYEDTAIVDLIQETQLYFSGADISIAAAFNPNLTIPRGEITVGNIAGIYIYENFLYALEMTGQQIKDYLEYSSNFFNTLSLATVKKRSLVNEDVRGYNYDMAQGFIYEIDLTEEPGNRIKNMLNLNGTPFDLNKTYEVTLNSYRYNGGGGHLEAAGLMKGGILDANTTYQSSMPMRDLMVEYLKVKGDWGPEDTVVNWELVPDTIADIAVELQLLSAGSDR